MEPWTIGMIIVLVAAAIGAVAFAAFLARKIMNSAVSPVKSRGQLTDTRDPPSRDTDIESAS